VPSTDWVVTVLVVDIAIASKTEHVPERFVEVGFPA
jgi:hypothetical protein